MPASTLKLLRREAAMPPAMILCGGQGTRIRDVSDLLPKPMVQIGPHPIVWHIMRRYAMFGVRRFILCLGYKRESFINYFLTYRARTSDITLQLQSPNQVAYHGPTYDDDDWEVTLADTGEATMTGGRVARAAKYLRPEDENCFLTYGDGLADIDIDALYACHRAHGKDVTLTAVHPSSRYGEIKLEGTHVSSFHEKPQTDTGLINGGFMVLRRSFITKYLNPDASTILEEAPMRAAVADGQMGAYVHEGFWQCMDTAREHELLNQLWNKEKAPWMVKTTASATASAGDASSSPGTPASKGPGWRIGSAA